MASTVILSAFRMILALEAEALACPGTHYTHCGCQQTTNSAFGRGLQKEYTMTTASSWSYSAGERGRNRVRVFENRNGMLYVEFYERGWNGEARPKRYSLRHQDRRRARQQADEIAVRLGACEVDKPAGIALQQV